MYVMHSYSWKLKEVLHSYNVNQELRMVYCTSLLPNHSSTVSPKSHNESLDA